MLIRNRGDFENKFRILPQRKDDKRNKIIYQMKVINL